ncbi:MAG: double-strand break repair helicase AddA [Alphaproteobacteria bacterium]
MMDNSSLASDPKLSVFVSANAGTGKTRALTHRVFRLLLSGVKPDSILCVTYTKAAAAEMQQRLQNKLSKWAVCSESELISDLTEMSEPNPSQEKILISRQLFARILDNEDGPRIETIHSFCQTILSRFPIEAGVPPGFDLITESESNEILQQCLLELFATPARHIKQKLHFLAKITDERTLSQYLIQILQKRDIIEKFATDPASAGRFKEHLKTQIGCKSMADFSSEKLSMMAQIKQLPFQKMAEALDGGGKNDKEAALKIKRWAGLLPQQAEAEFSLLVDVFFSGGNPKTRIGTKAVRALNPELEGDISEAQRLILEYMQTQNAAYTGELSFYILSLAAELYLSFQHHKFSRGVLDFDDLIFFTNQLLQKQQIHAWVRWKLETAIQHVLVDEAQDTSPMQWSVISNLLSEFFESEDEEPLPRTFFAVGDYKQSIYSFQNADPNVFIAKQAEIKEQSDQYKKPFKQLSLSKSYRSSAPILSFVDAVMQDERIIGVGDIYVPHSLHWTSLSGSVELWPVVESQKKPLTAPFMPIEIERVETAEVILAEKIALHIKAFLQSGTDNILGRAVRPNDIMILVRKRDSFLANLRAALISARIPVSPPDRIIPQNQIEIQDLLALVDVCLSPEDDLQLASILKSPLLELQEEDLQELAIARGKTSLFSRLKEYEKSECPKGLACRKLAEWRSRAGTQDVFSFFNQLLIGDRLVDAFIKRLGIGVIESFNGFLQEILAFEKAGNLELSQFIRSFRDSQGILKRDNSDTAYPQVRLLTIHGSKGLEAPIIYLPDMLTAKTPSDTLTFSSEWVYWTENSNFSPSFIAEIRNAEKENIKREDDRLLYVALTRAEQALVIAGWEAPARRVIKNSWYELLKDILSDDPACVDIDGTLTLQFAPSTKTQKQDEPSIEREQIIADVPTWYDELPDTYVETKGAIIRPSEWLSDTQQITPHKNSQLKALERGNLIHTLLERLPLLHESDQATSAIRYIKKQMPNLSEAEVTALFDEVYSVLHHKDCSDLFSNKSLAEAAIIGRIGALEISGQIDRLIVTDSYIKLADFKTGRPSANPPEAYLRQMALYMGLLKQLYPDRSFHSFLIWTQSAEIMPLLNEQLNAYLNTIAGANAFNNEK